MFRSGTGGAFTGLARCWAYLRLSGHILRLLATGHYVRVVEPDVFANNRAPSYIDSGKAVSQLREARVTPNYHL